MIVGDRVRVTTDKQWVLSVYRAVDRPSRVTHVEGVKYKVD